jgi:flagellar hook-associated protein 3 FlgL
MTITGIGSHSSLIVQSLLDMRRRLDDLQRQISTGKRADTYAGIGLDRGFTVGLRDHLAAIDAYGETITNIGIRMNIAQTTLGRMVDIRGTIKSAALQAASVQNNGSSIAQSSAYQELGEMLGLLNTRADERYLFSGQAIDQQAVDTFDHIMNGDGTRAGLVQVVAERKQADLGTTGLGRLVVGAPTPTSVSVTEDAVSPFGFKLSAINTTLTGATVTGPAGVPPAVSVDLSAVPNEGENVKFFLNLPDGTTETITLVAVTSATPGTDSFTIGATPAATAANLQATLTASISKLADTALTAASAVKASSDFFGNPPQRVVGPPFDTATATVAGTPADTIFWYTGEDGPVSARSTATVQIDPELTASYGMRANEEGIRWVVQNIAALAVVTFSSSDPNAPDRSAALGSRVSTNLAVPPGVQKIEDIQVDLTNAQTQTQIVAERQRQTKAAVTNLLQEIEGVPTEEVAAQILALQTRLQASMQTTSMLYQTSLVNYM